MSLPVTIEISPDLQLRALRAEDHPHHLALMQRIYPPAFAYLWPDAGDWYLHRTHGEEPFLRDLAEPDAPYYQVRYRGDLAGIFRLKLHASMLDFPDRPALKIDRLYLGDELRGRGIGSRLVDYAAAEARRLGKSIIWLERMDTNAATIGFYRKCGFREGSSFRLTYQLMYPRFRGMVRLWRDA